MKRREFIVLLSRAALAWPIAVNAQALSKPLIGVLVSGSLDGFGSRLEAFRQGLGEAGYEDGRNAKIEYRFANDQYDRLPALATDLVTMHPAVLVTNYPSTMSAKAVTSTIPILFVTAGDPVKLGLVQSLNRPGGNITGVSNLNSDLGIKRLELIRELVPKATKIAILVNPNNANAVSGAKNLKVSADGLGLDTQLFQASTEQELRETLEDQRNRRRTRHCQ